MFVQRLLQINMATLVSLATLLLSMGQDRPAKPLLVGLAVAASIWLTDVKGWVRLTRLTASLVALPLLAYSLLFMKPEYGPEQTLLVADLVTWLQLILFFQKKEASVYWQLAILSLLQVVVAAWFNHGAVFGALLAAYVMTGMSALALLLLHTQWSRHARREPLPRLTDPAGVRWPLLAAKDAFAGSSDLGSRAGMIRELIWRLAMTGVGTLVLAAVFFCTVPRFGRAAWRTVPIAQRSIIGFSDTITLGQLGEVLESRQHVMWVELADRATRRPYPVQPHLYLRGAVLTHYENGRWGPEAAVRRRGDHARRGGKSVNAPARIAPGPPGAPTSIVVQKIEIDPLDRNELFCVWPPITNPQDQTVVVDRARGRLLRAEGYQDSVFKYALGTTAFADGRMATLAPCNDPGMGGIAHDWPRDLASLLQLPHAPHTVELARKWLARSGLAADNHLGRARALEQKFLTSGEFQYSLQGQPRDPRLDPIEDFVLTNRRGNCEYFAAALALMLRSQGIPARVVLGYKCDQYNNRRKAYQVRQADAHAWVEAYLAAEKVPPGFREGDARRWTGGAWLRLDPTPAADADAGLVVRKIGAGIDWIESFWSDYVMDMDRQRQNEAIYKPMFEAMGKMARNLVSPSLWRERLHQIGRWLRGSRWHGLGGWLVHVGLPLAVALAALWLIGRRIGRAGRRLWRRLRQRAADAGRRRRSRIDFYRRFETLLARKGLVRAAGQTPRELARRAADRIAAAPGREESAELPGQLVDAYYRVRFGGLPLDNPQREAVEHGLAQLERIV